jgi:hypothetical protein
MSFNLLGFVKRCRCLSLSPAVSVAAVASSLNFRAASVSCFSASA